MNDHSYFHIFLGSHVISTCACFLGGDIKVKRDKPKYKLEADEVIAIPHFISKKEAMPVLTGLQHEINNCIDDNGAVLDSAMLYVLYHCYSLLVRI